MTEVSLSGGHLAKMVDYREDYNVAPRRKNTSSKVQGDVGPLVTSNWKKLKKA